MNSEIISLLIFIVSYLFIIFDLFPRTIIVFFASSILVLLKIVTPHEALSFINWDAITLLFGMFTLVVTLKEVNFFKIVGNRVVRIFGKNNFFLLISLSLLTGILSAFMDSITVMMFISSLTIEISKILEFNPIPFILSEIVSSNIGGSATMVGDPPNVIIGTSLGYSFNDFLINVAPISIIVLIFNIIYFVLIFKKDLKTSKKVIVKIKEIEIEDRYSFSISVLVFVLTITLLVLHKILNISVGVIGLIGASLALFLNGNRFRNIWDKIDWDTLLFFIGLFIIVGSLEKSGFLNEISNLLLKFFRNDKLLPSQILIFSGILSSIVDNVPLAFSMVPIIKTISVNKSIPLSLLAWALSLGTDLGGNGTPIGASANVVALSILEKSGIRISWGYYLKKVFISTILSLILSSILLMLIHRF
ncbi:MAG: anion permease [Caldisericia bacterium]|nr:anion permease [Caldisericia bacterium]